MTGAGGDPEAVGVLGGSFDPVHEGHLRIADEARRWLRLSRILMMPAASPPHKSPAGLSPAHHRERMLRLAIEGCDGLEVCTLELDSGRVCYTIETLRQLRDGEPPLRPVFVLGMDSVRQITTWRSWPELIREFDLAAVDRVADEPVTGGGLHHEVAARLVTLSQSGLARLQIGCGGRIIRLPTRPIPMSSSAIRARIRAGGDPGSLVPPAVARYIHRTGLYRQEKNH